MVAAGLVGSKDDWLVRRSKMAGLAPWRAPDKEALFFAWWY
jgi:hypothetical protein